jgi:protein SCO1/2
MSNAVRELAGTDVRFVSFSVDPVRDTPERLREYAAEFGADLTRWSFLTGDFEAVRRVCLETLMFDLRQDESLPIEIEDGQTMPNIVHPAKLVLIGPDRRVLSMYDFNIPEDMDALRARARAAAQAVKKG